VIRDILQDLTTALAEAKIATIDSDTFLRSFWREFKPPFTATATRDQPRPMRPDAEKSGVWADNFEIAMVITYADLKTMRLPVVSDKLIKQLTGWAGKRGWFVHYAADYGWPKNSIMLEFQPFYGQQVKVPRWLWHITDAKAAAAAVRGGLKPSAKSKDRYFPARIYLFTAKAVAAEMGDEWKDAFDYETHKTQADHLLKIDTTKLRKGTKFFLDTEFRVRTGIWDHMVDKSVWTYTHIPARAVTLVAYEYD